LAAASWAIACWPTASAAWPRLAACCAILALALARVSWMRRPSYCSLSELIWNQLLGLRDQGLQVRIGRDDLGALMPPGTARASVAVAAARLAARLSLRTAMHDIGTAARLPTDSVEVLPFKILTDRLGRSMSAAIVDGAMAYTIRPARTGDVPVIRKLIDSNVESGRLLTKATVTLYEDVQEFCVAELTADATVGGCGALHVMWEDLAEIRTVAVREDCQGLGLGHAIVDTLLRRARAVGVSRVFCLTFAVEFFGRHGFQRISGTPVAAEVYRELLRSYDEGVAEFLDLERVKPNTLGNTRMLLRLLPGREK
jgi:N-acetylglutamate synthase and related acetyltransferases